MTAQSAGLEQRARELLSDVCGLTDAMLNDDGRIIDVADALSAIKDALAAPAADGVLVAVFVEQMDMLTNDYADYEAGKPSMPFVVLRDSIVAALHAYGDARHTIAAAPQAQGEGDFVASAHIGNLTVFAKTAPRDESDKPEPPPTF